MDLENFQIFNFQDLFAYTMLVKTAGGAILNH